MSKIDLSEDGVYLIAKERNKQLNKWSAIDDDERTECELAIVASILILENNLEIKEYIEFGFKDPPDWDILHKDLEYRDSLIVAGALIAAEIDRVSRLEKKKEKSTTMSTNKIEVELQSVKQERDKLQIENDKMKQSFKKALLKLNDYLNQDTVFGGLVDGDSMITHNKDPK